MDINTQNSSGMMNGMPPAPRIEKKVGPIVGVLIIVLILIVAALYFFGQKLNTESGYQNTPAKATQSLSPENTLVASASSADSMASMQADLNGEMKDVDYSF